VRSRSVKPSHVRPSSTAARRLHEHLRSKCDQQCCWVWAPEGAPMSDLDPCLAIVPARGGSKGLPGKNIRMLAGLPLIAHALACARMVPRIRRTIVSTDSEEIAEVARAHGGEVPFLRPPELAQDTSPMMPVLAHALDEVERGEGQRYGS